MVSVRVVVMVRVMFRVRANSTQISIPNPNLPIDIAEKSSCIVFRRLSMNTLKGRMTFNDLMAR